MGREWNVLNAGDRVDASNGFATSGGVLVALRAEAVGEPSLDDARRVDGEYGVFVRSDCLSVGACGLDDRPEVTESERASGRIRHGTRGTQRVSR